MNVENNLKARVIAFYLPQYYPIPENDKWWGKGFTEWTNVAKAKPLYRGHYQPHIPADLGFYDLRVPETRQAQADMAKKYGIEGFCYWHYWFGNGKRLLERPFNEVLVSGKPDFPFCLAWANETWKGFNFGIRNRNVLIEQRYFGIDDYRAHFYHVLPAFKDKRYITVEGKPLFMIYKPLLFPDISEFIKLWQKLAIEEGLKGIYFIGQSSFINEIDDIFKSGLDAINTNRIFTYINSHRTITRRFIDKIKKIFFGIPMVYNYKNMYPYFTGDEDENENVFPTICPNWDHSPRSGKESVIFYNSTPKLFENNLCQVINRIMNKSPEKRIIFLKSWNEWAEGNYVEPDLKYGLKYLEVIKKHIL